MIPLILALAACAAQDLEYPLLEKDPWAGFVPGSFVVRETNLENRFRSETTITLRSIEVNSKTFAVLAQGQEEEVSQTFTPFSATLLAPDTGNRLSGKSNRIVALGGAKVKASVREIGPADDASGTNIWRLVTADEFPGGICGVTWTNESEEGKASVSYDFKGLEKLKVHGKELSCAKFEARETQTTARVKKGIEASLWLSSQVPGLLVKSVTRVTLGKEVTETTVQTVSFEAKK
jgi:hypothetical protein